MRSLPSQPGVYWFLDDADNVLYVGKAKDLKKRVSSYTYFARLQNRTKQLVVTATRLKHQVLQSELEALLTEAELIRTYQPPFNIALKDDKSPLYIQITKEDFPQVLMVRKKEVIRQHLTGTIIGPFQSAYKVKEVLKIVRPIFPWCNAPRPKEGSTAQQRACFYYHLRLCPGVCVGKCSVEEYQETIRNLTLFLRGKTKEVVTSLKAEMQQASEKQDYERAGMLRDRIALITEVTSTSYRLKPDLLLSFQLTGDAAALQVLELRRLLNTYLATPKQYSLERIECYDVSNMQGQLAAVANVVSIAGEMDPSEYKLFNIRTLDTPNDYHMLQESLQRRQNHAKWGVPDLLVIDGGKGQLRAALTVWQWNCPVISIAKDPDRIIIPSLDWSTYRATPDRRPLLKSLKYHELTLPEQHPALVLIQKLRNEAHRFSKKQFSHRKLKQLLAE